MAHKIDVMDIKQIIRLHIVKQTNRQIAKTLGFSRNTVNKYIQQLKNFDESPKNLLKMETCQLEELFVSTTTIKNHRYDELMLFFEAERINENAVGFTFLNHYEVYVNRVSEPYGYTQFMEHHRRKYKITKGSMKLNHEAGRELFIDYTGKKLHIIDRDTGEVRDVEVFIALLPFSQYTYVEASYSQKKEDLIASTEKALRFYGGTPKAIVSDNLKSAVTKAHKYEPIINKSFKDFAQHYGCVINPARSYSPQDKALVEGAVKLVYQQIYYKLRNCNFFSLEDLNKAIQEHLARYNDKIFQVKKHSRRELFQSIERSELGELPNSFYEIKDFKRAKVQKIGHVFLSADKNYYSVPYQYIGKHTQIQFTQSTVEVFYDRTRIAFHKRSIDNQGIYITKREHLASSHNKYLDWSPNYFISQGTKIGVHVERFIKAIFAHAKTYPELYYKRALGVLKFAQTYGDDRLDKACKIALEHEVYSYYHLKNILKNGMDKIDQDYKEINNYKPSIPIHDNIRGSDYYK